MSAQTHASTPYKGLMPYSEEDAPFFFGRETEQEIITSNLMASRLTLLYGPSGVGKSSVLRAGVAHNLRRLARENLDESGSPQFAVVVFNTWRDDPVAGLEARVRDSAMLALNGKAVGPVSPFMKLSILPPSLSLVDSIRASTKCLGGELLIILDQFEEYFLYHGREDGEHSFAVQFPRAVNSSDLNVNFLISIRDDALAKLDMFQGRIPILFDNRLGIAHLDRSAAQAAITKPIEQFNRLYAAGRQRVGVEPELVGAVLDQVKTGEVVLGEAGRGAIKDKARGTQIETPYLQLVMERLWNEERAAGSSVLRLETLDRLGGAESIVKTHLDAFMLTLTPNEQEIASDVFHYLVTPSGTKIAHIASDLAVLAERGEEEVTEVLEKLSPGDVRILRPVDPPPDRPKARRFEIFHDVLAPAILNWRTQYVQVQQRIEAERRAEEQRRRADEQASVARRLRLLAIALAVVTLLAISAAALALVKQGEARAQRTEAQGYRVEGDRLREKALELEANGQILKAAGLEAQSRANEAFRAAEQERKKASEQRDIAIAARKESEESRRKAELESTRAMEQATLAGTLKTKAEEASLKAQQESARAIEQAELAAVRKNEADAARALAESEGKRALKLASDTRVGFSNLLAAQAKDSLDKFPQRSLLLAVEALKVPQAGDPPVPSAESALREVLSQTGGRPLIGHSAPVNTVAISSNNQWVASVDDAGNAFLWNLRETDPAAGRRKLPGARGPLSFSSDGRWLVTARGQRNPDSDLGAVLWDLSRPDPAANPRVFSGYQHSLDAIAVSRGNRWLVLGTTRKTANWSALSGRRVVGQLLDLTRADAQAEPLALPGDANFIMGISPDGRWLATDSRNDNNKEGKVLTLWDLSASSPIANALVLSGHTGEITNVRFSPDGRWLATSSGSCSFGADPTVRLWDLTAQNPGSGSIVLRGHKRPVTGLVFTSDSTALVTGGDGSGVTGCNSDADCLAWDLSNTSKEPVVLRNRGVPVAIDPSGQLLITQRGELTTHLSALSDSNDRTVDLNGLLVGLSSDNRFVVTASIGMMENQEKWLRGEFTSQIRVWDLAGIKDVKNAPILRGHEGTLASGSSIVFSPDNGLLVTGSQDKTVRLWNLNRMPGSIHSAPVRLGDPAKQQFLESDGRWLVTSSRGSGLLVYDLATEDPAARAVSLGDQEGEVWRTAISSGHHWLVTLNSEGRVRRWNMKSGNSSSQLQTFRDKATSIGISRDERWLAVGYDSGTTRLWDLTVAGPTASPQKTMFQRTAPSGGGTPSIDAIYFSADDKWLITRGSSRANRLWNLSTATSSNASELGEIDNITISPDGRWLAFSSFRSIKLWDLSNGNPPLSARLLKDADLPLAFSSDGRWLFTGKEGWGSLLWDLKSPERSLTLPNENPGRVVSALFSPDVNWVVARGNGDAVWLWRMNDLTNQPRLLQGDSLGISSIDISADSRWLAIGSFPNHRLYDLRNPTGTPITFTADPLASEVIGFSREPSEARWLIMGSDLASRSAPIELWSLRFSDLADTACRTAGRNLTAEEWKNYFPGEPYRRTCPGLPAGQ